MLSILYIDSADDQMKWLSAIAREGFTVLAAKGEQDALDTLATAPDVGLVLLDHGSTGLDPLQLLAKLEQAAIGPRPEIHLFSHREDMAHRGRYLMGGVDDILSKGSARREIIARLHASMARAERLHGLYSAWRRETGARLVDAETGFYNLRYLRLRTREEVARSMRERRPISAMMIEFLSVADLTNEFGSEVAKQLLLSLAQRVRGKVRGYDILCRVGPMRLAVLCPGLEAITSYSLAKRMLDILREEPVQIRTPTTTESRDVHLAVGLTGIQGDEEHAHPGSLLSALEQALEDAIIDGGDTIGFVQVKDPGQVVEVPEEEAVPLPSLPELEGVELQRHNLPLSGVTGEDFPAISDMGRPGVEDLS